MGNKLTRRNVSSPAKFIRRGGRAVVSAALPLSAPCRAVALAKADQPSTISYTRLISAKQRVNVGNERVSKLSKVRSSEFGLKYECCFLAHHRRSVFPNARFELVNFDVAPHDGPSRQMKPSQTISKATPRLTFTVACCGAWRLSPNAIRIYAQYVPARAASYTRRLDQAYGEARGARGAAPVRGSANQNGDGTVARKIEIITSAITSLPIIAPRLPTRLPHPARP